MAKVEKFEDLICWQKANELVKEIYKITSTALFSKDYALKDQSRRAAISIPLNIAEGFGRKSHKEFKMFLFYSHGSIAELQACLYIARDLSYIDLKTFNIFYNNCMEISKIISGLIKSL